MHNINFVVKVILLVMISNICLADNDGILPKSKYNLNSLTVEIKNEAKAIEIEQSWMISKAESNKLISTDVNHSVWISDFPEIIQNIDSEQTKSIKHPIELTRYNIMAPGAKIQHITPKGIVEVPHPDLMVFIAHDDGVGLVVNPSTKDVNGIISQQGITMTLSGNLLTGLDIRKNSEGTAKDPYSKQCLTAMEDQPGDPFTDLEVDLKSNSLVNQVRGVIDYETIIAVDTDNEWMAGKGNNNATAMTYIVNLFSNMNVFYERDLSLRLLIGNVILRTAADPFPTVPGIFDSLNDFGEYWRVNNDHIDRDFTVLLSGQSISSSSFSGIAWINQYCENGFLQNAGTETVGSYSVNRIGSNLTESFTAEFLGHELGHNLGSPHTHCYSPEVDNCYNAESGCFAGTPVCPAGGSGTIMSYCHFGAPNGANCGNNDDEFHPTVITLLETRMLSNFPACIQTLGSDIIFADGFE